MTLAPAPERAPVALEEDDFVHRVCECMLGDPDARHIAMCGLDVTEDPFDLDAPEEDECIVCVTLDDSDAYVCPRCGE